MMGRSDRELLLQWLRQVEQSLQHQIDDLGHRVFALDTDHMRHLESHLGMQKPSDNPREGEIAFKFFRMSARGKAAWIAIILLLAALVGLAWRWPLL
jgi:hypothetical protein